MACADFTGASTAYADPAGPLVGGICINACPLLAVSGRREAWPAPLHFERLSLRPQTACWPQSGNDREHVIARLRAILAVNGFAESCSMDASALLPAQVIGKRP